MMAYRRTLFLWLAAALLLSNNNMVARANWQPEASSSALEAAQYASLPPTVFAPGGRLFSVERALRGVQDESPSHNLVVALRCRDGIVIVTNTISSPYLMDTTTAATADVRPNNHTNTSLPEQPQPLVLPDTGVPRPPFTRLSTHLWGVTAGRATDAQLLRLQLQSVAESLRSREDSERESLAQPCVVARALADVRHRATQAPANGQDILLNATAIVFDSSNSSSSSSSNLLLRQEAGGGDLWRVDPTGQFWQCQAVVVGRKADAAEADLLDRLAQRLAATIDDDDDDATTTLRRLDPATLRQGLADLTQTEALSLAAACIREALAVPTTTTTTSAARAVSLKGLCFHDGQPRWFTDQEL